MALHIELIETGPKYFTVICGERFADHLACDEALGVVAAALFGGQQHLPFLKTYVEWDQWDRLYRADGRRPVAALLAWNRWGH